MNDRISRDAYGLKMAEAAASRADCTRRQVGAVIVNDDGDIVATGYNGAPAGEPGCLSDGACPRGQMSYEDAPAGEGYEETKCIAIHAEVNAVIRAGRSRAKGATIYVTDEPCYHCSIVIRAAGIVRVVTPISYLEENAIPQRWIVGPGSLFDADQFNLPLAGNIEVRRPFVSWSEAKARKAEIDDSRRTPRVFTADDPEPTDVAAVRDRMGHVWPRVHDGWAFGPLTYAWSVVRCYAPPTYAWSVIRCYAPLTEVLDEAPAPRVWRMGDPEPVDRPRVFDADGDPWLPGEVKWYLGDYDDPEPSTWESLLKRYSPLTEVAPSGEDTR